LKITKLHIILLVVVLAFGTIFSYQYQQERKRQAAIAEAQRRKAEEDARERLAREQQQAAAVKAVAVAGEYWLTGKKEGKDLAIPQETLRKAKESLTAGNFELAESMARQAIEEFKTAKTLNVTYTVKRGDSLWRIARMTAHYGKGSMWPVIWRANEHKIPDFDVLRRNQVLLIPKTEEEIKKYTRTKKI
jgi:nucleoid-associated protein YgaU